MQHKLVFQLLFILSVYFSNSSVAQDCQTAVSLPIIENFDNYATVFPSPCWQRFSSGYGQVEADENNCGYGTTGSGCVRFDLWGVYPGDVISFTTPLFNATTLSNTFVSFNLAYAVYNGHRDSLVVECSVDGGNTFAIIHTYISTIPDDLTTREEVFEYFNPTVDADWGYRQLTLPIGTNRIRFRVLSGEGTNLFMDNIMVVEAPALPVAPTDISFSNISAFTMQLNWTDNAINETGYRVYVSLNGVDYSLAATLPPGTTSFMAENLLQEGSAYFKVVSVSQAGESEPLMGTGVTTGMPPLQGFPLLFGTGTTNSNDAPADPIDGSSTAFSYQFAYTAAELKAAGILPNTRFAGLGFSISQDYGGGSLKDYIISMANISTTTSIHNSDAGLMVRNPMPYNPHVTLEGTFEMLNFDDFFTWNGLDNILVKICSGASGTENKIAGTNGGVRGESVANGSRIVNTGNSWCNDVTKPVGFKPQVQFDCLPPTGCSQPSSIYTNILNSTGINFGWVAPAVPPDGGYDWEMRVVLPFTNTSGVTHVSGHAAAGVTSVSISTTSHPTMRGGVRYRLYVKSTCAGAQWVPCETTFMLNCSVKSIPFSETFTEYNTVFPPACWTTVDPTNEKPLGIAGVSPTYMSSGSGSAKFSFFDKYATTTLDFTTPVFTATPEVAGGKYVLGFDHAYASNYGYDIFDELKIRISRDGGATYKDTVSYMGGRFGPLVTAPVTTNAFTPSNTQWARKFIELGPGINRIQFRGIAGYGNNLYLDNLRVEAALSSPTAPTSLTGTPITTSTIKLNWVQGGTTVSSFEIYRSLNNVDFELVGSVLGTVKTYTDALLSPSTLYYYRIVAVNQLYKSEPLTGSFSTTGCTTYKPVTHNLTNRSPSSSYSGTNPCVDLVINNNGNPVTHASFDLTGDVQVRNLTLNGVWGYSSPNKYKLYIEGDLNINGKPEGTTYGDAAWDFMYESPVRIKGNINVNKRGSLFAGDWEYTDIRVFGDINIRDNGRLELYNGNLIFSGTGIQKINDSSTSSDNCATSITVDKKNGSNVVFTGSNKELKIYTDVTVMNGSLSIPTGYLINNSASSGLFVAKDATLNLGAASEGLLGSNFSNVFSNIQLDSLSTVVYNSSTPQMIVPYSYGNLGVEAGSKFLTGNTIVRNQLSLSNGGILSTGPYTVTANAVDGGSNGYVVTDNAAGALIINKVGNTPVTFPVGYTSGGYTPAYISNSEPATFSVNAGPPPTGGFLTPDWTVDRIWDIKRTGGGNATLQFEWNTVNEHRPASVANKTTGWVVGHYCCGGNATWQEYNTAVSGTGPFKVSVSNINTFSPFAVGLSGAFSGIILPVQLLSFNGSLNQNNGAAALQWHVAQQQGIKHYVIEKSFDGISFQDAGIKGATGLGLAKYDFTDLLPFTSSFSTVYYRLKIVGINGEISYSGIVSLNAPLQQASKITLYPNPVSKGSLLQVNIRNGVLLHYKLSTAEGKVSMQKSGLRISGIASVQLPATLSAGVYYLYLQTDKGNWNERLIVK
jgi:hypothetical protein